MTKMSAKRHLKELQWRFMLIALFFVVGATLAFAYRDIVMPILLNPLNGQKLVYLTPAGGFTFTFLVAAYAGLALAFPILLQQLYAFLKPALPEKAQKKSAVILVSSVLLLTAGIVFGYLVAVPSALTFLFGFADQYVDSVLTADSYLNFVVAYTIGIGLVFQLPLLLLLIHAIKPLTPGGLMKSEKWVVLIAFIVAALITPTPDPVNQAIIAGPVIVVYQIGVIAVLMNIARASRRSKAEAREAARAHAIHEEIVASLPVAITEPEPTAEPAPTLAFEEAPVPEHISVAEVAPEPITLPVEPTAEPLTESLEAIAEPEVLEEAPVVPIAQEIVEPQIIETPEVAPTPVAAQPTQLKVIDGFVRRSPAKLEVPQRPVQPARPQARPIPPAPKAGPAGGFYVDGIIAPRIA